MRTGINNTISVAFTSLSKNPCAQVLVGWTGYDISSDVSTFSVTETDSHEANSASFRVSNLDGQYDLLAEIGSSYLWLRQNEPIYMLKGYSGVLDTIFTGCISTVRNSHYQRGETNELQVQCIDNSKMLFRQKITTGRYENKTINNILTDPTSGVLTSWAGITTSDIAITGLGDVITSCQFNDEYPMDAAYLLTQVKRNTLRFRYDGKVENFLAYGSTTSADVTVLSTQVSFLDSGWNDQEIANKVIVIGAISGTRQELDDAEELQATGFPISSAVHWYDYTVTFTNPPVDASTVRLEFTKRQGMARYDIIWIKEDSMRIKFEATWWANLFFSGYNDMHIEFKVYAQHIATLNVYITSTALDSDLYYEYGDRWVEEKVENPCICNTTDAVALATSVLDDLAWQRYRVSLEIPDRYDIQPGDTLKVWNSKVSKYYWVYTSSMTHSYTRGSKDSLSIDGYWMQTTSS